METKLLPCPFCGGEAKVYDHKQVDPSHICVYCLDCGAQTKKFYPWFEGGVEHREECIGAAIEAWNARFERTCDGCDAYEHDLQGWCENCARAYPDLYAQKGATDADN